jgi:pantoate--beta-alanine ligase
MEIITSPEQMQATALTLRRAGRPIGLAPTMGFLHAGHLSLVKLARKTLASKPCFVPIAADMGKTPQRSRKRIGTTKGEPDAKPVIVLSLFVNPTQFGPKEDFSRYPRNFENDRRLCEEEGVDIIFYPSAESMYHPGHTAMVDETTLAKGLCGASRPGHFRGVLTVVAKLFNLVLPDAAVFGQKDAQQARLIQRMALDLNFPTRIIIAPIIRESDGLAMSSRNTYLSPSERREALCLVQALQLARDMYRQGERDAGKIVAVMARRIRATPSADIDYIEVVDDATLQPTDTLDRAVLIALAVRIGKTRLIDNLMLPDDQLCQVP